MPQADSRWPGSIRRHLRSQLALVTPSRGLRGAEPSMGALADDHPVYTIPKMQFRLTYLLGWGSIF